jgi:uncharacterized protein (DUF302 family)
MCTKLKDRSVIGLEDEMKFSRILTLLLAIAVVAAVASPAMAQDARVAVPSKRSFDQTISQLKSNVSQAGMMIMATVDQGNMLSMTGLKLRATLFLVGNPNVGKMLFAQDHAVGLYVPLRVFVYEGTDGKTYLSYDKPSALFGQFNNGEISKTAAMLDEKLEGLAQMSTH